MSSWKISSLTDRIRRAFSEAADQYDILASLHREIGRELVKKYTHLEAQSILDVGCGTGYTTAKVKFFFPESRVIGLDFAPQMIAKASAEHENITWLVGDAHQLPFKNKEIDLVISNLAYQWALDLSGAFGEVRRVLSDKGTFAATLFGYHTCDQLFSSLQEAGIPKEKLKRLPTIDDVKQALNKAGFGQVNIDYERIQIQFKDLWDLLGWLKAIGANELSSGIFLGPQTLQKANEYYRQHYPYHEGVCSTFEVIWIHAQV